MDCSFGWTAVVVVVPPEVVVVPPEVVVVVALVVVVTGAEVEVLGLVDRLVEVPLVLDVVDRCWLADGELPPQAASTRLSPPTERTTRAERWATRRSR